MESYMGAATYDEIIKDEMLIDAVVRNLEIIGEASSKIPEDKYSSIEWRKIKDFRNILAHEYFGIDMEILGDIIQNKLPQLKREIKKILIG
ncbi:MAG: HepT-like ribonuclease domain-containing protein [Nitrospirota bacterium]